MELEEVFCQHNKWWRSFKYFRDILTFLPILALKLPIFNVKKYCTPQFILTTSLTMFCPGGGALTLEGSSGVCHPQDPLFRPFFSSGDPPFQVLFLAPETPILSFLKNLHFRAKFSPILANYQPLKHKFSRKFVPPETLVSSQKNQFRRPNLWSPGRHRASNSPALRGSLPPGHYFSRSPAKHVKSSPSMGKEP